MLRDRRHSKQETSNEGHRRSVAFRRRENEGRMDRLITARAIRTADGIVGDSILVKSGVVAAVGARSDLASPALPEHRYEDAVIVPGLRDAHLHPVAYTALLTGVSLKSAASFPDLAARLAAAAAGSSPGEPIVAMRLDDETLAERRLPQASDLDAWIGDRPALVHRYCGHIAVASSAALALAGVTSSTADPPGGLIDRGEDGAPTGVLRETAIDLVSAAIRGRVRVDPARVSAAMRGLAGLGITSIGAMVRCGEGAWASLGNEALIVAEAGADIPIRIGAYVTADDLGQLGEAVAALEEAGPNTTWRGVKRFGDGSLGGHTAAMNEPFADRQDARGLLRLSDLDAEMARAALAAGRQVAIHAIGDRACSAVVDLFETLVSAGVAGNHLRLEHASVMTRPDVARLAATGAIASVQPPFLTSETSWLEKRLGADRLPLTYAFRSLEEAGVTIAGGSDCPVESPDPWAGMAAARDRAGIVPAESLSAERALALYTTGGATALGEAEPLAAGSPADFVVVDRDPVLASPAELRATVVIDTYVGGEAVEVDTSRSVWVG